MLHTPRHWFNRMKTSHLKIRWNVCFPEHLLCAAGFRTLLNATLTPIRLLLVEKPQSAIAFVQAYVKSATERHPSLLLPVKPNPREYRSPSHASKFSTTIYMTASPPLNFSQNAVALVCDIQSTKAPVSNEMKAAWQSLLRQFVQDGGLAGMESLVDVRYVLY